MSSHENKPYRILRDVNITNTTTAGASARFMLAKGDEGTIIREREDVFVITQPRGKGLGRTGTTITVPKKYVEVGPRKVTDWRVRFDQGRAINRALLPEGTASDNISTLLSQIEQGQNSPIVYAKVVVPGIMDVYSQRAQKVSVSPRPDGTTGAHLVVFRTAGSERTKAVSWPWSQGPALGTQVFVTFEVMHHGPHQHGYGRLPDLPETTDWDMARAFAIAIMWKAGDKWQKKYVQCDFEGQISPRTASKSYIESVAIVRSLRQERVQRPVFLKLWPPALVLQTEFNWFEQTLYRHTKMEVKDVEGPEPLSVDWRMQQLLTTGIQNVAALHGSIKMKTATRTRTKCDHCQLIYLNSHTFFADKGSSGSSQIKCVAVAGNPNQCTICERFNIKCSYTNPIPEEYKKMVLHKPESSGIIDIEDPQIIDLMADDIQAD